MLHRLEQVASLAVLGWAAYLAATVPTFLGLLVVAMVVPLLVALPLLAVAGVTGWLEREVPRPPRPTVPPADVTGDVRGEC